MKRSIKRGSNIYSFLDSTGLLENGSSEQIELAKKQYWRKFRTEYKKNNRKENKSFEVPFDPSELKQITAQAKKSRTSPTNYIKQSALINKHSVIDPSILGEIRELIVSHYNTLLKLNYEKQLPELVAGQLLKQASTLEKRMLYFFSLFKQY